MTNVLDLACDAIIIVDVEGQEGQVEDQQATSQFNSEQPEINIEFSNLKSGELFGLDLNTEIGAHSGRQS